ncbi:uncharacterized protein C7orf57 homolog isoform X1 [Sinocyclocheilus grahami]|uniref:Uncharacterized protein n=1 Tax=Sinocyclocheilus grahami TaxID=75366 RepID=A0A672KN87_SINGR|nr:PREDICTED: uncharacterized protein C7orf57 homolog isoform X1 [Sinocyclocheilus grahami]XP_016093722.1 PREDICTED: uncharacterized protein C7orf57 homolog isoform X1 [Sinocyclocheilus grahami]XP_016093723.1 PREDICTED: uncharacterized protein C7orf57 homolog isoform X1 [Sinocyclocheilus grahami]XP_016093724.1 PREDICTED: uncharacterized protein C7orf57 homolog isoform X1 [Sinocyclocheilus grahami]
MAAEPNYRRTKPGVRTANLASSNGAVGPSSQIPGLSATADTTPQEITKGGRRVGIQATDSDYVKLAKQGGQRGLLSHDDPVETKPNSSYKPSNWFSGTPDDQESSSEATTPDGNSKSKEVLQHLEAPFGTDNCSAWDSGKKNVIHAASEMQKLSLSQKEIVEANKFKKISHEKKGAAPVNMSKLLSFGYVEEENKSLNDDDASSITSELTSTIAPEEELE